MTEDHRNRVGSTPGRVVHLASERKPRTEAEEVLRAVEMKITAHFQEQNEILKQNNIDSNNRVQRLTNGIERLLEEMHGVRTGSKEEAFARIGPSDAPSDLPTVSAESALFYIHTAKQIGEQLGFHASQIGALLGHRGLKWAGNGDYQEIGRTTNPGHSKFWHKDVPGKLRRILDENDPAKYGIDDRAVLSMFRKWKQNLEVSRIMSEIYMTKTPH